MGWGRRPAKTVGTRQDGEMSKGAEVDSSMSERPQHQRPRRLADWLNPTGRRRVHSLIPPSVLITRRRLRESGMRENRTYRLSGGRRPAPAGRASSDPTPLKAANKGAQAPAESPEGRASTKGNSRDQSTHRTQGRDGVLQAVERIRQAATRAVCRQPPKVGAVCVNAHVRICAGGPG